MFDARTFSLELDKARTLLEQLGAVYKGEYVIRDVIFASKDPDVSLDQLFLRLRVIPKNIWDEEPVIVAIKGTELRAIGKLSHTSFKKGFADETEARRFITENFKDSFELSYDHSFEFTRTGWQYDLGSDQVDLEDIEGHHSIEFKSPTEEGLGKLLNTFGVTEVIRGPSVSTVKTLLGR